MPGRAEAAQVAQAARGKEGRAGVRTSPEGGQDEYAGNLTGPASGWVANAAWAGPRTQLRV